MASIKLSDGREIKVDLNKISVSEFRATLKADQPDEEEYATLGKAAGLSASDVGKLGYDDYRRLAQAFYDAARQPLADPNP